MIWASFTHASLYSFVQSFSISWAPFSFGPDIGLDIGDGEMKDHGFSPSYSLGLNWRTDNLGWSVQCQIQMLRTECPALGYFLLVASGRVLPPPVFIEATLSKSYGWRLVGLPGLVSCEFALAELSCGGTLGHCPQVQMLADSCLLSVPGVGKRAK